MHGKVFELNRIKDLQIRATKRWISFLFYKLATIKKNYNPQFGIKLKSGHPPAHCMTGG